MVCGVGRNAVSRWIDSWRKEGIDSLLEAPKPGRPTIIKESEWREVVDIVKEEIRQLKRAVEKIFKKLGKRISVDTLKRILKKKDFLGDVSGNP